MINVQNSMIVSRDTSRPLSERLRLAAAISGSIWVDADTTREIVRRLNGGNSSNKVIATELAKMQAEMKVLRAEKREAEDWAHQRVIKLRRMCWYCLALAWAGLFLALVTWVFG